MPNKTQEYLNLAQQTAKELTRYWENWTDYLTTASRLYKYNYGERRPMNAICDTTAKSETLSVKGCKVKITYAPADTDCLDAIQKLLQTTILRTAGHTAA